ncbi:LysR family transcriptional regulator [Paraburkholderia sp. 1N]|uniref:LysR family transcriptional regulator n=1 Tax=Paraburkholderia solitsugae TaxID=2675748 RepID=A0ABX2BK16_9BURK|nr:LysR family transcriptional regulator [Paraburkholderia solitsugae]NPT40516.1 LysR family transcriptional regulator [Paraburkholderia solitsugae]
MNKLQAMRVFVRVVEVGSFTGAVRQFNTTTGYASRAISNLEAHLRVRLLNRTTRRIAPTEAGVRYLQRCKQILAYVDQAEAEASGAEVHLTGKLRVHAINSFGQHYLVPIVHRYQQRHPDVHIDLTLAQRAPDLLGEGYDVALALMQSLPDSNLVWQRLGSEFSIACASPGYLKRNGVPKAPSDLKRHTCLQTVTPVSPADQWLFDGPNGRETFSHGAASFRVNVTETAAIAASEGMGIGLIPVHSAINDLRSGKLVWIMPEYTSQTLNLYALYPSHQYLDAKVRAWVELLRDELPATLAADQLELPRYARTAPSTDLLLPSWVPEGVIAGVPREPSSNC